MADLTTKIPYTISVDEITFGQVQKDSSNHTTGDMPTSMTKIGKVYRNTCVINQDSSEKTEHYEEGRTIPEILNKTKKSPVLTFSLMVDDLEVLKNTVGGDLITNSSGDVIGWGFNGNELPDPIAVRLKPMMGADIEIPNGDIDAVINANLTQEGLFLVDVTLTPLAVDAQGVKGFRVMKPNSAA